MSCPATLTTHVNFAAGKSSLANSLQTRKQRHRSCDAAGLAAGTHPSTVTLSTGPVDDRTQIEGEHKPRVVVVTIPGARGRADV